MTPGDYESERLLHQYLLFHYGAEPDILGGRPAPPGGVGFPERCAQTALSAFGSGIPRRALDLGCAVGGSSFALARACAEVVGLDLSVAFIRAAFQIKTEGRITARRVEEGDLETAIELRLDPAIDRTRVRFVQGDACAPPADVRGPFDVVLAANVMDRVASPRAMLRVAASLVSPGGVLAIISPYTWLESFTPRSEWLGGRVMLGRKIQTSTALQFLLSPAFELVGREDLPFVIREHCRKFQWGISEATVWRRRKR